MAKLLKRDHGCTSVEQSVVENAVIVEVRCRGPYERERVRTLINTNTTNLFENGDSAKYHIRRMGRQTQTFFLVP